MRFEVTWQYWDAKDEEQVFESKQYASLCAATDRYEQMKKLPDIESVRVAVIIEEYNKAAI